MFGLLTSVGRTAGDVAAELAGLGARTVTRGLRSTVDAASVLTRVAGNVVSEPSGFWHAGTRMHVPLRVAADRADVVLAPAARRVASVLAMHPDIVFAYWDGGLGRLVVNVAETEAAARVSEVVARHADRLGLRLEPPEDEELRHPGEVAAARTAAATLAFDAIGFWASVASATLRLPRTPAPVTAAATVLREDPRARAFLRARLGDSASDLLLGGVHAAVQGWGRAPSALILDAAVRTGQLVEALAQAATFDAVHDRVCSPRQPECPPPQRRPDRPVPTDEFAAEAVTGGALGSVAALLLRQDPGEAAQAIIGGAPKPVRCGPAAFQSTFGTALAAAQVLVRNPERLRLLASIDAILVHPSAVHGTRRTIVEVASGADGWDENRLWHAVRAALDDRSGDAITLTPASGDDAATGRMVVAEHGTEVGTARIARELHPRAESVLDAARRADLHVVLLDDGELGDFTGLADEVVDAADSFTAQVSRLREQGRVVLTVARPDRDVHSAPGTDLLDGLLAGDLSMALADRGCPVLWSADLLALQGISGLWRVLAGIPSARAVQRRSMLFARAGATLAELLVVTGQTSRRRSLLPRIPLWRLGMRPIGPAGIVDAAGYAAVLAGWGSGLAVALADLPPPRQATPWHALEPPEVLDLFRPSADDGTTPLGELAARSRSALTAVGRSPVLGPARVSARLARTVTAELRDPLTPLLAVGAGASALLGSTLDAGLVTAAIGMNALVGGVQRLRTEDALHGLVRGERRRARLVRLGPTRRTPEHVERADQVSTVDAARIRPGDVIELRVDDVVPADARLITATDLEVDESALTGESLPVPKQLEPTPGAATADRRCMVFADTTVVAGTARAVVVGTGPDTESGRAVNLAARAPAAAGIQARLHELTRRAIPFTLAGGAAVAALAAVRGHGIRQAVQAGLTVAVVAVPEGLPLVATVTQLAAARRLSRHGVLVRTPRSLEALGRVDTVCFDKTGTLTENRLRLARVTSADQRSDDEAGRDDVLRAAARACPHDTGDPAAHQHATDAAILDARPADPDWAPLAGQPFEASRGYAAAVGTVHDDPPVLVVKGAPEVVLPLCGNGSAQPTATVDGLAADGLRVLAVARKPVRPQDAETAVQDPPHDLELLGFVGLADTPRDSAPELVAGLRELGTRPLILTGDHQTTARAVATQLGWPADTGVLTGEELLALDRAGQAEALADTGVIARVAPEQKVQVIEALRAGGRTTAMVGDGANDAAAIRAADVGIGVAGRGSSAARNAADLVLTNGDLTVLLDALREGRGMWHSVSDAISVLLGGNAGEVGFSVLGTVVSGRAPLTTRQLLLVNLFTDMFPAMAVAVTPTETADETITDRPVGQLLLQTPLTTRILRRGLRTGLGASTAWLLGAVTPGTARRTSTMALCALIGGQLVQTLAHRRHNTLVLGTVLGSAAALVAIVQTPVVSRFFGCTPLGPVAWTGVLAGIGVATVGDRIGDPIEALLDTPQGDAVRDAVTRATSWADRHWLLSSGHREQHEHEPSTGASR